MESPPPISANGASRTTGGILCGRAQGNVFNYADSEHGNYAAPRKGKVYIYQSSRDPRTEKSDTSILSEVTTQLKPILKTLAQRFSPVSSK